MLDERERALGALRLLASEYGVGDEVDQLEQRNVWLPGAVAMLAEALAALVIETDCRKATGTVQGRRR